MSSTKREADTSSDEDEDIVGPVTKYSSLPKGRTFFADQMLNTHARIGLSRNMVTLLNIHDNIRKGFKDEDDLGRELRLSAAYRKAIEEAIYQCSQTMQSTHSLAGDCNLVIEKCIEMQEIASMYQNQPRDFTVDIDMYEERPASTTLPYLKFPPEIRARIIDYYFKKEGKKASDIQVLRQHPTDDNRPHCSFHTCPLFGVKVKLVNVDLLLTSSRVRDEALAELCYTRILCFNCTCVMASYLDNNIARDNVHAVRFHWRGPTCHINIPRLYRCKKLKGLIILISKMTTYHLSARERVMAEFFKCNMPRLTDANGLDELLKIRGLEDVLVKSAPERQAQKRPVQDSWELEKMLRTMVLLPRPEGYGENGGDNAVLEVKGLLASFQGKAEGYGREVRVFLAGIGQLIGRLG